MAKETKPQYSLSRSSTVATSLIPSFSSSKSRALSVDSPNHQPSEKGAPLYLYIIMKPFLVRLPEYKRGMIIPGRYMHLTELHIGRDKRPNIAQTKEGMITKRKRDSKNLQDY